MRIDSGRVAGQCWRLILKHLMGRQRDHDWETGGGTESDSISNPARGKWLSQLTTSASLVFWAIAGTVA